MDNPLVLKPIGHYAAARFAQLLKADGLTPVDAGILRIVAAGPGISQQELARTLKIHASKLVHLKDPTESRSLVIWQDSSTDRRMKRLTIDKVGQGALTTIR